MILTAREKSMAIQSVAASILGQEITSVLKRAPVDSLYGKDDSAFSQVNAALPFMFTSVPPLYLMQDKTRPDAMAEVLPDADVLAQDRLIFEGTTYRIQTVKVQRLYGAATHKVLELVKLYGS